ncbi:hypothetical protein [Micromonospora inositola]|uniref:Immunity protein 35 n=1 Tax=Micromonospora inositola TaxID=47865 RepID=A0A1C5IEF2_9ACTN|nr:hypothetical protein [Micromonospora inositola]SCG56391.1 hypothetical protein GA0070613_2675 [Micromonospora inositola]
MAVTYEQARDIVRRATEPDWPVGTYCLDDRKIVENDAFYVFEVGAREFLVGGDMSYMMAGSVPVVYKADGRLEFVPSFQIGTDPSVRNRPNPTPTLRD